MNQEIDELKDAEKALHAHDKDLIAEWNKPLKVNKEGYITQGMVWIPGPFANDFWSKSKVKPKPCKCVCPECGSKHTRKGGI